jgi:ribosomal protein S18 acetylase RimI-like enzyme
MATRDEAPAEASIGRAEPALSIRRAEPADLAPLVEFNAAMARETEGRELDRARLTLGVRAALERRECGRYWIAEQAGASVGCLLVTREWSDWRNGWFWWIQSVYVERSARRRGVYRALYEHVLSQARAAGDVCGVRLYVDHDNANAQSVYERLGMQRAHYRMYEVDFVLPR